MPTSDEPTAPVSHSAVTGAGEPCVVLLRGGRLGHMIRLAAAASLGRDDSNTIVLNLNSVSRQHARLSPRGDCWVVEDAGSRNGTYLNDRRTEGESRLSNGDIIQVGDAIFKFLEGGDVESRYHEEIYRLTIIDPLTELYNKRYLRESLSREIARAARHQRPLSLVMMDLDRFKLINDRYGHGAGDHVLRSLSRLVKGTLRQEELAARYGGEELVFVLPETGPGDARSFAERVRQLVAAQVYEFDGQQVRATASFGIATLRESCSQEQLISYADAQLYRAKQAGRNRVVGEADVLPEDAST